MTIPLDGEFEVYGVIGYPVKHSLSPLFQNAGFRHLGIKAVYVPFEIKPENLPQALKGLFLSGVRGLNVTIPHKEAVMDLLDFVSEEAKDIGAVNTIKLSDKGIEGYNTDWIGFLRACGEETLKGKRVLVLGAGGSSRAILYALNKVGAEVFLWNRTKEKAIRLAQTFSAQVVDSIENTLNHVDVIVNTTSVGLKLTDPPLFDYSLISPDHTVVDIVYPTTPLLESAKRKGAHCVSGLSMLLHQGAESFRIWTGCPPPIKVMREALFSRFS